MFVDYNKEDVNSLLAKLNSLGDIGWRDHDDKIEGLNFSKKDFYIYCFESEVRKLIWENVNFRSRLRWIDKEIIEAINLSGATDVIINKCDIIKEVDLYKLFYNDELLTFSSIDNIILFVEEKITNNCSFVSVVSFSYSPLFV